MKALLLVHHPLKADEGLPKPVAQEASLEKGLTELLQLIGQGHSGQQSWPMVEMLRSMYSWRSVMHLSVTSKDDQEHEQEGPAAHMLTQQVDQIGCLVNRPGLGAVVSALGLDTTLQRAQERRPNHWWESWTRAWWVNVSSEGGAGPFQKLGLIAWGLLGTGDLGLKGTSEQ